MADYRIPRSRAQTCSTLERGNKVFIPRERGLAETFSPPPFFFVKHWFGKALPFFFFVLPAFFKNIQLFIFFLFSATLENVLETFNCVWVSYSLCKEDISVLFCFVVFYSQSIIKNLNLKCNQIVTKVTKYSNLLLKSLNAFYVYNINLL